MKPRGGLVAGPALNQSSSSALDKKSISSTFSYGDNFSLQIKRSCVSYFPTLKEAIIYLLSSFLIVISSLTASTLGIPSNTPARDSTGLTLQQQLELAGTPVNRLALIPIDQDFVFDFNTSTQGITQGQGTDIST